MVNAVLQWFAMGGYAAFVWSAYVIAATVLGGVAVYSWRRYRQSARQLAQFQQATGREG